MLYLDQNKWIDLARAVTAPGAYPEHRAILELLCTKVEAGELLIPLTSSNIFETQKTNKLKQRFDLAHTQVVLSGGAVFRGYHRQLEVEVAQALAQRYGLPFSPPEPHWFLSRVFFESTAESADPRLGLSLSAETTTLISKYPQQALLHYLINTPEAVRTQAISRHTEGCEELRKAIEERRQRDKHESVSIRRKIYAAITAFSIQTILISIAASLGLPVHCFRERRGATLRALMREVPAFNIEIELALRLESLSRPITLNDMRDMRTFGTVLPHADIVIAEKLFTNLARQAGFNEQYGVQLETDLRTLPALLR